MRPNPNFGADRLAATVVACPFCGATVGQLCWVLKDGNGVPVNKPTKLPHKARIKLGAVTRMKEGR